MLQVTKSMRQVFYVELKMGIYIEVFYYSFDVEVMELYLSERYGEFDLKADSGDTEYFDWGLNKTARQKLICGWLSCNPSDLRQ